MKLKHVRAHIRISELHTQPVEVPLWEVPLLEAVHEGELEILDETEIERKAPEASDEFRRLATKYGNTKNDDGSRGIPYVASVYGQYGVGTSSLQRAIEAATVDTPAAELDDLIGPVSSVGG